MIDAASANAFIPADGPHRVLVQLQLNTDPDEVAEIVSDALSAHRYYIAQVKPWDVIPVD